MRTVAVAALASTVLLAPLARAQELQTRVTPLFNLGSEPYGSVTEGPSGRYYYLWVDEFDTQRIQYSDGSSVPMPFPCPGHYEGVFNRARDRFAYECWHDDTSREPTQIWTVGVDTVKGVLTGVPRRVSLKEGWGPAFSPDDRFISYSRSDSGVSVLVTVPATGGDEHVVVRMRGSIGRQRWSPDGGFIYFTAADSQHKQTVERVRVSGGTPERVADGRFNGFSPDGRLFATESADGSHIVIRRVNGAVVGQFKEPANSSLAWSSTSSSQMIGIVDVERKLLTSLGIASGQSTLVPGSAPDDLRPQFTPDGAHIVFLRRASGGDSGPYRVMFADADGSHIRALPTSVAPVLPGWVLVSPDGRTVAFTGPGHTIQVLDLATGKDRTLPTDSAAQFRWRSDSKALLYFRIAPAGGKAERVCQVTLTGRDSLVRTLPLPLTRQAVYLVNDTLVAWTNNTGVIMMSLRSPGVDTVFHGRALTLFPQSGGGGQWLPVSRDGKSVAFAIRDSGSVLSQPYVMSLSGTGARPLGKAMCDARIVAWLPNGADVIEQAKPDCEAYDGGPSKLYLVPINGEPIRNLTASDRSAYIDDVVLAPDGARTLFSGTQQRQVSMIRVDITIPPPRE